MRSTTSPRRTCTRSCTRSTRRSRRRGRPRPTGTRSGGSPQRFSELAERHLGVRRDLVAAPLLHDTAGRDRPAAGRGARLARRRVRADPGRDDAQADRGRARLPARRPSSWRGARAAARAARHRGQGRQLDSRSRRSPSCAPSNGAVRGGVADGRPSLERVEHACEAILALSGTTNGRLAVEGFRSLERTHRRAAGRPRRLARRRPDHLRRRAGAAADGDHLAGVVGDRGARPPLRAVHDQRRAREAVAHALGPPALLSRPCVDARARRGPAGVPPAAASPRDLRRPGRQDGSGRARADAALSDAALEVVDPLRVSGQPAHADAVPRRRDAVDQPRGRRGARHQGQRLGRGLQPQRRRRLPRDGLAPHPARGRA